MSDRNEGWHKWREEEWNDALFFYYFKESEADDQPVLRISITQDQLPKIVSDLDSDPHDIMRAFLKIIHAPSNVVFNRRLSRRLREAKIDSPIDTPPPFFIELAFSCIVALPPDKEIRNAGDYRNRLAMLLGHESSSYPLTPLPKLWKILSKWLDNRRAEGKQYRRLELPAEDYRKRIGFSINLTFPTRKDQINLIKIFHNKGLDRNPPLSAIFDLVGREIDKFSPTFRKAYEEFRVAFASKAINLERLPFWGAVRDAIASAKTEENEERENRELKLVIEPPSPGVILLLSSKAEKQNDSGVLFHKLDTQYENFDSVLCASSNLKFDFDKATQMLLQGHLDKKIIGSGWQAIQIAIHQGILLFKKTESLSWELVFTRQEDGVFWAVVKNSLIKSFLDAFLYNEPFKRPSRYEGWSEVEGISCNDLNSLLYSKYSPLSQIRCLQQSIPIPRLLLIGGCPVENGFLGIPACLPTVRAPFSDKVYALLKDGGKEIIGLQKKSKESADFSFPLDLQSPLDGHFFIVGSLDGRIVVRREVFFRPDIVANDYARPTDPAAWTIEAAGPDFITYEEYLVGKPQLVNPSKNDFSEEVANQTESHHLTHPLDLPRASLSNQVHIPVSTSSKVFGLIKHADFNGANHFMEIFGGLSMRRKGIPEVEVLDLVSRCFSVNSYTLCWKIIRAWMEAGYFNRLSFKRWRRTQYFSCPPQIAIEYRNRLFRGVLTGLATASLRNRIAVELEALGAIKEPTGTSSQWVIPLLAWSTNDVNIYKVVSEKFGLLPPKEIDSLVNTLWSISDVVKSRDLPPKYFEHISSWDWKRGCFSRELNSKNDIVGVLCFHRPDRPPFYQVMLNQTCQWWSISRNWALLVAHVLKKETVFNLSGDSSLVRVCKGQVYLPLPIGRYLAATGMRLSGPSQEENNQYCYRFRTVRERQELLTAFWEGKSDNNITELIRLVRSILAISKRKSFKQEEGLVALPTVLRKELQYYRDVPELIELSRKKIDPFLLPRVREIVSKFKELRE